MDSTWQLILTGLITAAISVPTSLLLARLTFKFVKRAELKQALADALELEKGERGLDRMASIREKVTQWTYPILDSAKDLHHRLENILDDKGYVTLAKDWDERRPENWSATHSYFLNSSIYLFGRYFAHLELLRRNLGLDFYPQQADKDSLFKKVDQVSRAMSKWPTEFTADCAGIDRQIFLLDQRAMGQAFLDELNSRPITYAEFLRTAEDLRRYTDPVRELLTDLTPAEGLDCRWARLESVRGPLTELREECSRLTESVLHL